MSAPATNPPMWAKNATLLSTAFEAPSDPSPSITWSRNQNPSTIAAGTAMSW